MSVSDLNERVLAVLVAARGKPTRLIPTREDLKKIPMPDAVRRRITSNPKEVPNETK